MSVTPWRYAARTNVSHKANAGPFAASHALWCQLLTPASLPAQDEIRMVVHLRLDLEPIVPADPPSLVDLPITQHTSLCRLAHALHREGGLGASQPGVCGIGRPRQEVLVRIVAGLGAPPAGGNDPRDGG